jgi:hypothetical protein
VKKLSILKKSLGFFLPAMVMALLLTIPLKVQAGSPLFSLDTFNDWDAALTDGRISPVLGPYPAADEHYGTEGLDYLYVAPEPFSGGDLYVMDGITENPDAGLVMAWGDPDPVPDQAFLPQLSAWEYTYPEDPNLVGTLLKLTVMPPPGIWSVSLTLNDAAGGWVSWDWNVIGAPPPFAPGVLTPGAPNPITINPTILGPQAGSTSFALAPGIGFNPTIATTIQADELAAGPGGGGWNQFPPAPVINQQQPWNYWSSLSVVPEPVSSILFVAGGATLGFRRFWKKRKQI